MKRNTIIKTIRLFALGTACTLTMTACSNVGRLANIGQAPDLSPIENPTKTSDYRPVSMPMPTPTLESRQANSLWSTGRQGFFKDQRAKQVGDILTVMVDIDESAEMENTSERSRDNSEGASMPSMLGYEAALNKLLPEAIDNENLAELGSTSSSSGTGTIEREEKIEMKVAAVVSQILPNGNMVIHGRQEVRVNFEKRILEIAGVIRPEDISTSNSISYEQIAEARISYGGQGQITDVQQPRYGQQVFDVLFPF